MTTTTTIATHDQLREALSEVIDPDLGVNVVDLGFLYGVDVDAQGAATLRMTLTSPACPLTKIMEDQIHTALVGSGLVTGVTVQWVFSPVWSPARVSETDAISSAPSGSPCDVPMIVIMATYRARAGVADGIATALREYAPLVQAEPGCLGFTAHRNRDDPDEFVLYERYLGQAEFDVHVCVAALPLHRTRSDPAAARRAQRGLLRAAGRVIRRAAFAEEHLMNQAEGTTRNGVSAERRRALRGGVAVATNIARPEIAYRSLANELREAILADRYANGVRLPTEAELSRDRGLSRQTVRRALQDLVTEGLIYRVRGRGTFASGRDGQYLRQFGSVEDLMGLALDTELELLIPLHDLVDAAAAQRLGVEPDHLMGATFRRIHDGTAFCSTRDFLPIEIGRLLVDAPELTTVGLRSRSTVIGLIDTAAEQPITGAEQAITVAPLPAEVAGHLRVPSETPVLRIDRTYYDPAGTAVELAISYFLPKHYTYRVRLHRTVL